MKQFYHFLMILFIFGFTTNLYSQSVPSYVPTNGLVGWWGFNGNAQDGSGNGNHGTVNGATLTTDRFGNQNGAYSFDGVDDYIQVTNSSNLLDLTSELSISSWFIANNTSTFNAIISKASCNHANLKGYVAGLQDFITNGQNPKIHFQAFPYMSNASPTLPSSLGIISSANWIHFVAVYNHANTVLKYHMNGILIDSIIIAFDIDTTSLITYFGNHFNQNNGNCINSCFNGKIDDIGIWNRALSPQEITNLYNSQLPTQTSLCLPSITTNTPNSIGIDSVIVGGNITNDGGSSIVLRGVCYSTTPNPNMGNMRTEDGAGVGFFSTILRNLSPSTTYYVRSYAKNSNGVVVYGNEVSFSTGTPIPSFSCGTSTVSDVDGNNYNTVQIGTQCWTQSNLKVSKYRNEDSIPTGLSDTAWQNTTAGAYAIYDNNPVNDGLYGKLYNHYAVMDTRGLCPTGWHVPTDGEWNRLVKHLDPNADTTIFGTQSTTAGGVLKSTATQPTPGGWTQPNTGATNSSGFSAGPGGLRYFNGVFYDVGTNGFCWSSAFSGTDALRRTLNYNNGNSSRDFNGRTVGFSVRCLRD
jgi:uncharacterized protein (TIGR02145 family)